MPVAEAPERESIVTLVSQTETNNVAAFEQAADVLPYPLIGPADPAPFSIYNAQGKAPILLVCDHASREFPAAMKHLGVADWVLDNHVTCDIGAAMVTRHLAERLDAPAVLAGYSRLIIDLNRQPDGNSTFIKVSDGIAIPGNLEISEAEKAQRIRSFFKPYHDAISRLLAAFKARDIVPAFLSIHSCTPVFNDVFRHCHIGVMWDRDPRIPVPLMRRLEENPDLRIGDNEPYSGRDPHDYTVDFHAERTGFANVGIEVRQDLVDTAEGAEEWADILGDAISDVLKDSSIFTIAENQTG